MVRLVHRRAGASSSFLSLGPWLGIQPTEADPDALLLAQTRSGCYQYILVTGYLFCVPWYFFERQRRWFWWSVVGSGDRSSRSSISTSRSAPG